MTLAESSISDDSERSEEKTAISKESHIKRWWRWKHNPPQALVLRQEDTHLGVEEINEANKESNSFEIQLPRWSNRVHVFADMEEKKGYCGSLRLNRLGVKKNWQRRLGTNYQVLHVKGNKPVWPI